MADQFCLRWNNFQTNIVSALESLKCSEDLVDVTLTCEGRNIRAHKVILSACSPYFRTVFKENPCQHPVIILKDVLAEDIISLLSYMYQGEVFIEESKLTSFLHTAALLQVKGLTGVPQHNRENISASTAPITTNKLYTQLTISSKPSPFNSQKESKSLHAPKKRRSSTSDKPNHINNFETYKKSRIPEQNDQSKSKNSHAEPVRTENENETKENKKDNFTNTNGNSSNSQLGNTCKDGGTVTVKKEVEDEEASPAREQSAEKENASLPDYENSMLARSLLSGINPSKSDINANNSSPKNKMQLKMDAANLNRRDGTNPNVFPNAKKSPAKALPISEEQIKFERQSPKLEVEFEPEVLISEQGENAGEGYESGPQGAGSAGGASTSHGLAHQQSNHAAICGDCPHCGMKYSNQSALKYHVRLMHSDLTNRLCCYLCPRSFTMRETFKEHMWTTHGQRN